MSLNKSTSTFNKAFSEAKSQIAFGFFMKFPRAKSTSTLFLKKITKLWLFASLNAFPKVDKKEVVGFFYINQKKLKCFLFVIVIYFS
jgi:hypothetical protein